MAIRGVNNHSRPGAPRIPIAQRTPVTAQAPVAPPPVGTNPPAMVNPKKVVRFGAGQYRNTSTNKTVSGASSLTDALARFNRIPRKSQPPVTNTTPEVAPPLQAAPPAVSDPLQPATTPQAPGTPADTSALYPSYRSMLPKSFEDDPIYNWTKERGMKELDAKMASRGLIGSGAEIEGNRQLINELNANSADRYTKIAQDEADRLERIQENEANRLTGRDDANWQRQMDMLGLALGQNPMEYAYDATKKTGDLTLDQSKAQADALKDLFERIMAPASRGGGAQTPLGAAPPGAPDYTGADIMSRIMGNKNTSDMFGTGANIWGSISKLFS